MRIYQLSCKECLCLLSICIITIQNIVADDLRDLLRSPAISDPGELLIPDAAYDVIPAQKRYASLYYGGSRSGYGRRGWRNRNRYGSRRKSQNYRNRQNWRPWERLPDNMCYRQRCQSSSDCCRRYNKCDRYARVCHDCWYGYPCKSSNDCCLKYPTCSSRQKFCT